jgi:hypothetical protein
MLLGSYSPRALAPLKLKMAWMVLVFIPVIPLGIAVVRSDALEDLATKTHYTFYGSVRYSDFVRTFGWKAFASLLVSVLLSAALRLTVFAFVLALVLGFVHLAFPSCSPL